MARFSRLDVYHTMLHVGLVPLFYHDEVEIAVQIVRACNRGGAQVVEFTNRGENAYPVFVELLKQITRIDPQVILGTGSVVDAPTAALFIAAGANFIVSPSLNPEVARLCNRRKVAYVPGCATPTEIAFAEELGAEIVKIFPGQVGGPGFIKAVLAPSPWTRLMPTGGVDSTEESIAAWIKAGAAVVGMGSNLISSQRLRTGDYDSLAAAVANVINWIQTARG